MNDTFSPEHRNPTAGRSAKAPYNFVPLPGKVLPAPDLPDHDTFKAGLTGHFVVRLSTQSPTYIRGMLTTKEFRFQEEDKDIDGNPMQAEVDGKKVRLATPFRKLVKNKPEFFNIAGEQYPVIPGSSLRGMLRTLFEIVTFSKVQPVSDALKMYFRAVAAMSDDPHREPYKRVIGNNATRVHVGYLERDADGAWWITPALTPQQVHSHLTRDRYIKVRKDSIANGSVQVNIPGFVGLDGSGYRVQYYDVQFDIGRSWYINRSEERKEPTTATRITLRNNAYPYKGVLVATGNMLETSDGSIPSPRVNIYLVPDRSTEPPIRINTQSIEDYQSVLTPFQTEYPFDRTHGMLTPGRPVFYVPPQRKNGEIIYFGHTPNFRIQHVAKGNGTRAVTPKDFVPAELSSEDTLDWSEAVFGYIRSRDYRQKNEIAQGDKRAAYSSRIHVTDACLVGKPRNIFFIEGGNHTLVPKILATPKPTSYQLYLAQPTDEKRRLKHYGSDTPEGTVVRGHKLYWHKGRVTKSDLEPESDDPGMIDGNVKADSTQHTQIKPLRPDLTFEFRVYFENLSKVELGALSWVLALPDGCCHNIGMGKPLGMGSVLIHNVELNISNRARRYEGLFDGATWAQPKLLTAKSLEEYKRAFEKHVLTTLDLTSSAFAELPRINALLQMLRFWERTDDWLSATQYMRVRKNEQEDDYTRRAVLPKPDGTVSLGAPRPEKPKSPSLPQITIGSQPPSSGTVAYYGKAAGGIQPDAGGEVLRIHKSNVPEAIGRLQKGQRVNYVVGPDGTVYVTGLIE